MNIPQSALAMPGGAQAQDFRPMTLRRLLSPLLNNRKLIGLGALVPFVVIYLLALMLPTTYSATSSILVEERQIDLGEIEQVVAPSVRDAATVASQIEIVLSDPVLEAAARATGRISGEEVPTNELIGTLDGLRRQLEVSRRLNSLVVDVTAIARSPEGAAQIANAVAEAYLAEQVVAKQEVADSEAPMPDSDLLGAYLLGIWAMPFPIVEAVRWHRQPSQSNIDVLSPMAIVHAAWAMEEIFRQDQQVNLESEVLDIAYLDSILGRQMVEELQAIAESYLGDTAQGDENTDRVASVNG